MLLVSIQISNLFYIYQDIIVSFLICNVVLFGPERDSIVNLLCIFFTQYRNVLALNSSYGSVKIR